MSNRTISLTQELYEYLLRVSVDEPVALRSLREETARHEFARMQISPEQGQFMRFLVELMGARRALEVGVFTGYSALSVALGLPEDGELVACDVSEEYTAVARRHWSQAGVANRISLRLGPALDTLNELIAENRRDHFDFAFIDADKTNYWNYFEACLKLVRPGGLILVDNVLWGGRVIDTQARDEDTQAIRQFNDRLAAEKRVQRCMVPIADGLTLARVR